MNNVVNRSHRHPSEPPPALADGTIQVHSLRMGEMRVANDTGVLRTLLGSCIGLSLYDPVQKIAGLAHIVLPISDGRTDADGRYVDTAVKELIRQMNQQATKPLNLVAQIAGGARMFADSRDPTVGELNLLAVKSELQRLAIPCGDRDTGGTIGRRMTIDAATGVVDVHLLVNSSTPQWMEQLDATKVTSAATRKRKGD